jgi:exo-beta-1,3-glucanase (GH17 family)
MAKRVNKHVPCRICGVVSALLLLAGGAAIITYLAVRRRSTYDPTSNTVAESEETANSGAANFGDRDKPVERRNLFFGMNYSPYGLGDNRLCPPFNKVGGQCILADQVKADMRQISSMTRRVKTYSLNCLPQTKTILQYAKENGLTVMLGVWVDRTARKNDVELGRLVEVLGEFGGSGVITDILVGNEALFAQGASEKELLRVIKGAKSAVAAAGAKIPVGTAEIYSKWTGLANEDAGAGEPLTDVAEAVDFIGLNVHPYFGGVDPVRGGGGQFVRDEQAALEAFWREKGVGKRVYITETGYPTSGPGRRTGMGLATPSVAGLTAFIQQVEDVSRSNGLPVYFFEPFNADWKRRWQSTDEYDYNFGLATCRRELKLGLQLPSQGAV